MTIPYAEPATAPVMVRLTAPSNLEEGYTFDAVYQGEVFSVIVPPGGVKAGQAFMAPFQPVVQAVAVAVPMDSPQGKQAPIESTPMLSPNPSFTGSSSGGAGAQQHTTPLGTWKSHWLDCLSEGLCHPSLCNAFWYPQVLMGQVLTRMKLDWCGNPGHADSYKHSTCVWMFLTLGLWYAKSRYHSCLTDPDVFLDVFDDDDFQIQHIRQEIRDATSQKLGVDQNGNKCNSDDADTLKLIQSVWFWVTVTVLLRLRRTVRKAHGISTSFPCEDFWCSACCFCCTVAQLARQTANYKEQRAYFCTGTGLAENHRQEELERRHQHGHHLIHAHSCDDRSAAAAAAPHIV